MPFKEEDISPHLIWPKELQWLMIIFKLFLLKILSVKKCIFCRLPLDFERLYPPNWLSNISVTPGIYTNQLQYLILPAPRQCQYLTRNHVLLNQSTQYYLQNKTKLFSYFRPNFDDKELIVYKKYNFYSLTWL